MVCAPEPVGVTLTFTVPLLVKTLIIDPMAEFTVVEVVAAPATAGVARRVRRRTRLVNGVICFLVLDRTLCSMIGTLFLKIL
jgi:hypothetical protein